MVVNAQKESSQVKRLTKPDTEPAVFLTQGDGTQNSYFFSVWRAARKFLGIPLLLLLAYFGISLILYDWDQRAPRWLQPVRTRLQEYIFRSPDVTGSVLGIVAGGLITQASIVISMLLLVLQQSATNMGNLVYDQYLRRHRNQVYMGVVLGSIILALMLRASVSDTYNPVLGATVVLLAMFAAVALLIWFVYSSMNQMRPEIITAAIHDETDKAYKRYAKMQDRLRRYPESDAQVGAVLRAKPTGYLVNIDLDKVQNCLEGSGPDVEIVTHAVLGDYVGYYGHLADIKAHDPAEAERIAMCIGEAYRFNRQRTVGNDPEYGLQQLEMVAWTEGSTSKQNPETVLMVVHVLKDLLKRWMIADDDVSSKKPPVPMVYDDPTPTKTLDVMESLAIASSESMQHEAFSTVVEAVSSAYPYLTAELQNRADELLRRIISGMGDHVMSRDLDRALTVMETTLRDVGRIEIAATVEEAHKKLAASVGQLANRSSRIKAASNGS